ncbi:MAG: hypothetical protein K8R23_14720 [Chthoniobacter sp.]|nr:hypothetical protein [Chthoniobacter sp.]
MPKPQNKRYLNKADLRILEEGFTPKYSPEERTLAVKLLRGLGYIKKSEVPKRPGPKSKSSMNQTDETLRRLVATIRAVLNLNYNVPKIKTLTVLYRVLATADDLLKNHFLLTEMERQQLRALSERAEKSEYGMIRESHHLLKACLDELSSRFACWDRHLRDIASYENFCFRPETEQKHEIEKQGALTEEEVIYSRLASTLKLDTRAWLEGEGGDGQECAPAFASQTLKEMKLFRRDVLATALGRLFHLESVFSKAQLLLSAEASEAIRTHLEENDYVIVNGPEPIRMILGELAGLFISVGERQGVHPCPLKVENLVLDRKPTAEGQISTGG